MCTLCAYTLDGEYFVLKSCALITNGFRSFFLLTKYTVLQKASAHIYSVEEIKYE